MDLARPHMARGRGRRGGSSNPALLDSAASSNELLLAGRSSPAMDTTHEYVHNASKLQSPHSAAASLVLRYSPFHSCQLACVY